jgi:hypothetical protein
MEMMLQENREKDNAETRRAQRGAENLAVGLQGLKLLVA